MKKPSGKSKLCGQGLVEYLVLVAVIGVATIGVASYLQKTLKNQYVNTIHALNGDGTEEAKVQQRDLDMHLKRRELGDFMAGVDKGADKKYEQQDKTNQAMGGQ